MPTATYLAHKHIARFEGYWVGLRPPHCRLPGRQSALFANPVLSGDAVLVGNYFSIMWSRAVTRSELPKVTFHSLRHSHASALNSRWPRRGESEPPAWTLQANHNACNLRPRIRGSRFRRGGCDREGTTLSEKLAPELAPDRAGQGSERQDTRRYHHWRCPQKSVQKGVPRDGRGRLSYAFRIGLLSGPRCGRIGAAALSVA